jgi:hypothetical protein
VRSADSLLPQIADDFGVTVGAASIVVSAYRGERISRASFAYPLRSLHFLKVAPASCPIAANVVCAAFNPRRKSLSEYAEYLSVA